MSADVAYRCIITRLPESEGGYFVVEYPELPGCLGVGDTEEAAIADGQNALAACLDALNAVGRALPPPA